MLAGGVLTGTLGWRYIFRLTAPVSFGLAILGWFAFPEEKADIGGPRPTLDFVGAGLGTRYLSLTCPPARFPFVGSRQLTYGSVS
jgi:hypothetical protein